MRIRLVTLIAAMTVLGNAAMARAEVIYGMTAASSQSTAAGVNLVQFDSATPGTQVTIGAFSGLVSGHSLREIDFRPNGGQLYAISTDSAFNAQVYTVNLATAALTPQGGTFALTGATNAVASIDFNPVADLMRIVTRTGQNYRWNPTTSTFVGADTSAVFAAGDVNTGTPDLIGVAYNNNNVGASQTTLFSWDYVTDSLITIGGPNGSPSPNGGQAFTVFAPIAARTFNAGFGMDISGATGIAYLTHDDPATGTSMGLSTIDLTTGAETTQVGYGTGVFISSISVQPVPEPTSMALCGLALGGIGLRAWRSARPPSNNKLVEF